MFLGIEISKLIIWSFVTRLIKKWLPRGWTQSEAVCSCVLLFWDETVGQPTHTDCWSQLTHFPHGYMTNETFNSSQPLPLCTVTVNGLVKLASSTQLGGRNYESRLEPLWVFFPIHLNLAHDWRVLPVPLCLNYLALPSWDAIIQTLIPCNFHTCVCTPLALFSQSLM